MTLDDPFATLDVNGGLALAGGAIGVEAGSLLLDQTGTISNGTITPDGGAIAFDGATLSTITWNGTLGLTADDATLSIQGTTIANQETLQSLNVVGPGGAPGTIDLTGSGARLDLVDHQTLNNVTIDIGASGTMAATLGVTDSGSMPTSPSAADVFLGSNTEIDQTTPDSLAIIDVRVNEFVNSFFGNGYNSDFLIDMGTINAMAPGGTLEVTGFLEVFGALNVLNGETLHALNGVPLQIPSPGPTNPGSPLDGISMGSDATLNVDATSSVLIDDRFDLAGTINIAAGGVFVLGPDAVSYASGTINGSLTDNGTIEAISGQATFNGDVTGSGTIEVIAGNVDVEGSAAGITFDFPYAGNTSLTLGDPNSLTTPIDGFTDAQTIDLKGFFLTGSSYVGKVLTLSNASQTITINTALQPYKISGGPGFATPTPVVTVDPTTGDTIVTAPEDGGHGTVPCFARGTRIATPLGEVAVETLRTGDLVSVASGEAASIVWIGHRRVDCRAHPTPHHVWPVRIRRDAFGPDMPRRDLFLSPDHAVFVEDVLIPIKRLMNQDTIRQVPCDSVEYFHLELSEHNVLLADGLAAESYLDTGDRGSFAAQGRVVRLFPDFCWHAWEAYGYARLVVTGPPFEAVRQRIEAQARHLQSAPRRRKRRSAA